MLTWGHQGATGKGKQDIWGAYASLEEAPGVYRDRAQTVELGDFSRSPCFYTSNSVDGNYLPLSETRTSCQSSGKHLALATVRKAVRSLLLKRILKILPKV